MLVAPAAVTSGNHRPSRVRPRRSGFFRQGEKRCHRVSGWHRVTTAFDFHLYASPNDNAGRFIIPPSYLDGDVRAHAPVHDGLHRCRSLGVVHTDWKGRVCTLNVGPDEASLRPDALTASLRSPPLRHGDATAADARPWCPPRHSSPLCLGGCCRVEERVI